MRRRLTEYITQNERMHCFDLPAANVINTVAGIGLEIKHLDLARFDKFYVI